jgi:predicted DNA-binding WGR domain protein
MKRSFYYQDDKSNKFWTIEVINNRYYTRNGRVGTEGRETSKEFESKEAAEKAAERMISSKLRKGYVEGEPAEYEKPDWASMTMSEDVFWRIIKLFNWKRTGDDDAVVGSAVKALSEMSDENIEKFQEIMTAKLYALDTIAHAREIGEYSYEVGSHFSVDWFLYVRCCVVANGKSFYNSALKNPKEMPEDIDFEALLYVASEAVEKKTGKDADFNIKLSYETFSNKEGWQE